MNSETMTAEPAGTIDDPYPEEGVLIDFQTIAKSDEGGPQVAVAFHFVEFRDPKRSGLLDKKDETAPDKVFTSFEMDLLSYQFRMGKARLISSQCFPAGQGARMRKLSFRLPLKFRYRSEGNERYFERRSFGIDSEKIDAADYALTTDALLSFSDFHESGVRVWHLVVMPVEGACFNEFDLLRFVHLWDGLSESTEFRTRTRFSLDGGKSWANNARELIEAFGAKPEDWPDELPWRFCTECASDYFTAGTIQFSPRVASGGNDLFDLVLDARQNQEKLENLRKLYQQKDIDSRWKRLEAIGGIVAGIFDFQEVDVQELLDTLLPTFADGQIFLKVSRGSLIAWMPGDRVIGLDTVQQNIGMSPYLLLPHAVLLHNEALVRRADCVLKITTAQVDLHRTETTAYLWYENGFWRPAFWQKLGRRRKQRKRKIRRLGHEILSLSGLDEYVERAEYDLGPRQLPDIFNYVTERTLYEEGLKTRGSLQMLTTVSQSLKETKEEVEMLWKLRSEWGQVLLAAFFAAFSGIPISSLSEAIAKTFPAVHLNPLVLTALAMVLGPCIVLRLRGVALRRRPYTTTDAPAPDSWPLGLPGG